MNHQVTQDTKNTKAGLAFFSMRYDELRKAGNVTVHVSERRLGQRMKRLLSVTLLIALASILQSMLCCGVRVCCRYGQA